jgi:antirestriction protein ArdC
MKTDVYDIITDRVVALLEKGTVPWQKSWSGNEAMPQNLISRRSYRGVNVFLLHCMNYQSPYWLTYNQALALGGNVRKGEKAMPVVFWKLLDAPKPGEHDRKIPLLRYYSAFNLTQCEGIPADKIPTSDLVTRQHTPIEAAELITANMPRKPVIKYGGSRAFYSPALDTVGMPNPEYFKSGEQFYSVLFHELTHSTGHESRLNRKGIDSADGGWSSGRQSYGKEELVAEMGAAFLSGQAGIVDGTLDNSASYIASWLATIKQDAKMVVQAAAQAQKAADYILGRMETAGAA